MPNKSRTFEKGGRPDWPSFRVRNIEPQLWEQVKARAIRESRDGNPRLNGIVLTLLQRYADQGLHTDTKTALTDAAADFAAAARTLEQHKDTSR